MICTHCKRVGKTKSQIGFSYEIDGYKLIFCNECIIKILPFLLGHLEGTSLRCFLDNNGIKLKKGK
jgi:hypothetical protein